MVLKGSLAFMQHFKFVNWWIRGFLFWCHEQVIKRHWNRLKLNDGMWTQIKSKEQKSRIGHKWIHSSMISYTRVQGSSFLKSYRKGWEEKKKSGFICFLWRNINYKSLPDEYLFWISEYVVGTWQKAKKWKVKTFAVDYR